MACVPRVWARTESSAVEKAEALWGEGVPRGTGPLGKLRLSLSPWRVWADSRVRLRLRQACPGRAAWGTREEGSRLAGVTGTCPRGQAYPEPARSSPRDMPSRPQ